ncbi:C-type lectin lectoxin-Lio2 [Holothuria leucospilota]|uniref:C-type lectin lectoxin-Lio2 n=1 Tax=Holothuria leucospilota TaxID=206669 RepID=A0A9Q1CPP8_HOLLE|nr:C-type lectin lectoxin-Lio2 [Holothuria leucospilota]
MASQHLVITRHTLVILLFVTSYSPLIFHKVEGTCVCGRPWTYHDGYCYIFLPITVNFKEAKRFCESYTDHLGESHVVSIHDEATNNFLVENVLEKLGIVDVWIGLEDVHQNGTFRWLDGSDVTYTNYKPGQPDLLLVNLS